MSASLVGSEMCIRDSFSIVPQLLRGERGRGPRLRPLGCHSSLGSIAAVSYTHLTLPTICSV
eukprot:10163602-Alexandrium_andersonii.AAC.1